MKVKILKGGIIAFIVCLVATPTLFSPPNPVLSCSQEIVNLMRAGDLQAIELYVRNHYNPVPAYPTRNDLVGFFNQMHIFGVKSWEIKASSPTQSIIFLENNLGKKKVFSLTIESNSPYMIQKLQEIPL
jgi:hypothetical protein